MDSLNDNLCLEHLVGGAMTVAGYEGRGTHNHGLISAHNNNNTSSNNNSGVNPAGIPAVTSHQPLRTTFKHEHHTQAESASTTDISRNSHTKGLL